MLIVANMTGLDRWYWIPAFDHELDGKGIWYWNLRWLGVELSAHSQAMGCEMIRRFGCFKQPLKVLETFEGTLDRIDGDTGYVTLKSTANDDKFYGHYPAAKFADLGVKEDSRFILRTLELVGGDTRIEIEAIPRTKVSDEEAKAIAEEMRQAFPGDSTEVLY